MKKSLFANQSPALCYATNEVLALKEAETKMVTTGVVLAPVEVPANRGHQRKHALTLGCLPGILHW